MLILLTGQDLQRQTAFFWRAGIRDTVRDIAMTFEAAA
jgi:hypothetical protein